MEPITELAIFGNHYQEDYLSDIAEFISMASAEGFTIRIESGFSRYLEKCGVILPASAISFDGLPEDTGVAVSIGGDGTFLRTARRVGTSGVPILGINTGHLGFLSHYTFHEAPRLLESLRTGIMRTESREVLKVTSDKLPEELWPYALNEVAILKEDTSSMINSHVTVDGFFLADYLADGVLISTPTGSTGYNLSVGGPIVEPSLHCMIVSPVAPHSLTMRPLVLGGDSVVELETTTRASSYRLSLDGCGCLLPGGSSVRVEKADFNVIVLLEPGSDFALPLRKKLLWGAR